MLVFIYFAAPKEASVRNQIFINHKSITLLVLKTCQNTSVEFGLEAFWNLNELFFLVVTLSLNWVWLWKLAGLSNLINVKLKLAPSTKEVTVQNLVWAGALLLKTCALSILNSVKFAVIFLLYVLCCNYTA